MTDLTPPIPVMSDGRPVELPGSFGRSLIQRLDLDVNDVLVSGFGVELAGEEAVVTYLLRSDGGETEHEARLPSTDVVALMEG